MTRAVVVDRSANVMPSTIVKPATQGNNPKSDSDNQASAGEGASEGPFTQPASEAAAPRAESLPGRGVVLPAAEADPAGSGALPFTGTGSLRLTLVALWLISVGAVLMVTARQSAASEK